MPSCEPHPYPLIFCDIENMLGTGGITSDEVREAAKFLKSLFPHPKTHWIVGASSSLAAQALFCGWPKPLRVVYRPGADGADRALLEAMSESKPSRFSGVVLCSGDGIFTEQVRRFAADGTKVTLVTARGKASKALTQAVHRKMLIHASGQRSPGRMGNASTDVRAQRTDEAARSARRPARVDGRLVFNGLPPPIQLPPRR